MTRASKLLMLVIMLMSFVQPAIAGSEAAAPGLPVASSAQCLEKAFLKAFNDPEEFKATGIFQLLGYSGDEIAQIGKITPRPASISIEGEEAAGNGVYKTLKVHCNKVIYYNLTIEKVLFEFPECSIDTDELAAGRLRFKTGEKISLVTEVSAADILKVFSLYAKARSLTGLRMDLKKDCASLRGRVKSGIVTVDFRLHGNTRLVDAKTVLFKCEKLILNGMPLPRNAIAAIFRQINPVFDAGKTWLNLNVAQICIKPGFVETHASIDRKKG